MRRAELSHPESIARVIDEAEPDLVFHLADRFRVLQVGVDRGDDDPLAAWQAQLVLEEVSRQVGGRAKGIISILGGTPLAFALLWPFYVLVTVVSPFVSPWFLVSIYGLKLATDRFSGFPLWLTLLAPLSFALGAFFAGMLLNESEFSHQAAQDSLPMRDAFAVLFFVSVGMLFDPRILVEHPWQVLATTMIILFGKSAAAYVIVRAFGHPNATALTISTSLAQIGEFAFIIAGLGLSLGLMPVDGHSLVLAGALISIMLNPILFMLLDRWQARQQAREDRDRPPEPPVVPLDIGDHAIIVGYGRVGSQLATLLRLRKVPLVVIEDDADLVTRARADGFTTVRGNAANPRVMEEAAPDRAKLAVFAIPQVLEAGEAIERLKAVNPGISVLARAHSEGQVEHLLAHGADAAVLAERELAYSLADMVMASPPYRSLRV